METRNINEIIYRDDLYPRFKPIPQKIQEYSEVCKLLPPIEIDQHNILIDGYHRWKAFQTAKLSDIPVIITEVKSEAELERIAVERNSKHGQQLTQDEKKSYAVKWWDVLPQDEILLSLSISRRTFDRWTKSKREQQEEEIKQRIYDLWMRCYTQQEIADIVGMSQQYVDKITKNTTDRHLSDYGNFRNFTPEVYTVWSFGKSTNEVKHPGNIPPEIIDNLLYYYTKPFDVVFDPFGGGGSTIDKCLERKRRYYVSDLSPIPARDQEIREWDITDGLPPDLPVPDLVFLDPPYWKQAEGKYSDSEKDLSNMPLDKFIVTIGNIARDIKRKWNGNRPDGKFAIIIGPYQKNWNQTDLAFMCYERIKKYLNPVIRIQVPYSTQVHGGVYVKAAQEKKQMLYLYRDLMVFKHP